MKSITAWEIKKGDLVKKPGQWEMRVDNVVKNLDTGKVTIWNNPTRLHETRFLVLLSASECVVLADEAISEKQSGAV